MNKSILIAILTFSISSFADENIGEKWSARGKSAIEKIKKMKTVPKAELGTKDLCSTELEFAFVPFIEMSNNRVMKKDKNTYARLIFEKPDKSIGAWVNVVYTGTEVTGYMVVELAKGYGISIDMTKGIGISTSKCHYLFPYKDPLAAVSSPSSL